MEILDIKQLQAVLTIKWRGCKTEPLPSSYYPAFADIYVIPPKGGSAPDPEPTPEPEPEPTPPPSSSEQPHLPLKYLRYHLIPKHLPLKRIIQRDIVRIHKINLPKGHSFILYPYFGQRY